MNSGAFRSVIGGGVLCSFGSSTQGPVGPESGSVTAGKGDSFVRAGLLSVFEDRYVGPLLIGGEMWKTSFR